ncbi:MAG TPA: DUF4157 domain-containing protein, partial [Thermoanaerobaculia bacterium]|nr:DUF4157 domain-containing protein [Thermoanaerobaculia bacterium]
MAEKTSTAKANEPAARGPRREAPPPVALGLTSTILELQQTAGNRSLGRLLGGALLQTKLRIGPAGDTYEREADRMADTVLRMPDTGEEVAPLPVSTIPGAAGAQRMCAQCEEEMLQREASASGDLVQRCSCHEEELVQTKTEGGPSPATPGFETRVAGLKGTGSPLPAPVRSFFEPRFGHDFGAVRVHTGTAAGEAARAVSARAFTVGNDVVFGAGEWSPETTEGRRLLAHELTHVVQQTPLVARREPLLQRAPLAASDAVPHAPAIPALAPANGPEGDPAGELEPPLRAEPGTAALSPGGSSPPEDQGGLRALLARLGAGLPLSSAIRSRMETAFGRSFAHVRVHTDSAAAGLATTLGARAFTVGEHIAFGAQEYRPGTLVGDALIAHELAHVAQQGDTGDRFAPLSDHGAEYDALEQDADLAAAGVVASLWGRLRFWTRPRPRLASGLRLQRCCCGRHRETVPPNNFCTECDREDHPDWQCCTPRMLQEIQDYRTQASDAVANALRALEPGNLARYASQLEKHFHLAPDDPRVAHVREQFARMDASLRGGSILFLCRAPGDPHGCEKPNVRAYSSNCTSGNGAIALCGHYNEIRDPASDNLLDPSHKGTFIHEFAHVACESGSGFIRPAGQETYYETGAFPGTADEAIHQADCYENFALEVGVVPASAAPAAAATQQDVVPEAVADASLPKCEYEEVGDWIPDPENRKQKLFGLTRLAGPIEFPAFAVAPSGKGVVVQETHPTPPTIKCQFLKPGLYLGDNMAAVEGRPLPVRVRWRITPRGSDLVKQGEREHCNDLIVAYDLSVRRLTGAINELATKKKVFANEAEARAELVKTVKLKPEDAPKYFQCIGRAAAAERDENRKWHTPKKPDTPEIREEPEGREGRKVKVPVYPLTEKSLPEVGRHSSLEVTTSVTPKCDNLLITAATPPEDVQGACAACEEELSTAELGVQPCPCEEEQDLPARAQPEEPDAETPVAEEEPAAALVVADEAETLAPGQMKKSDFFARLRPEVCAAAEAGLAGTEHSARGCPLIEFWLGYYEGQDVERINRDLPRFAGEEGPRPTTAEGFIALIATRVRTSVETWARTGKITGVPQGLPLPGMGLPGLGALGGIGGVFFKANPGGPRDPGDPRALQARLGAGRPLDGAIRSRMEGVFGRSYSHVRVHTDGGAAGLATGLNAKAFTVGEHVAFGAREYRPGTLAGDALI